MKQPKAMSSLLESALARHGIGTQVLAAQIVMKANERLADFVPPEFLRDMRVLSYAKHILTIACQNPSAQYEAQGIAGALCKRLEEDFPSVTFRCEAKLRPEAFQELY